MKKETAQKFISSIVPNRVTRCYYCPAIIRGLTKEQLSGEKDIICKKCGSRIILYSPPTMNEDRSKVFVSMGATGHCDFT